MESDRKPPGSPDEDTPSPRRPFQEPPRPALNSEEITIAPGGWTPEQPRSSPEPGRLTLLVRRPGGIRQAPVFLQGGRLMVGRTHGEIQIPDRMVSQRHAAIDWEPGRAPVLTDLGSTNGTFLNGRRVERPTELQDKDEIRLGSSFLSVRLAVEPS